MHDSELDEKILHMAARHNRFDIAAMALEHDAGEIDTALYEAAKHGNVSMIDWLWEIVTKNNVFDERLLQREIDRVLDYGARNGHLNVVKWALGKGVSQESISSAAQRIIDKGHVDVFRYLLDAGANDYSEYYRDAVVAGNRDLMREMESRGPIDYDDAFAAAFVGDHLDLAEELFPRVQKYGRGLTAAIASEYHQWVDRLLPLVDNHNGFLLIAVRKGDLALLKRLRLKNLKPRTLRRANEIAKKNNFTEILAFLQTLQT